MAPLASTVQIPLALAPSEAAHTSHPPSQTVLQQNPSTHAAEEHVAPPHGDPGETGSTRSDCATLGTPLATIHAL
jgi:hypothetical protein